MAQFGFNKNMTGMNLRRKNWLVWIKLKTYNRSNSVSIFGCSVTEKRKFNRPQWVTIPPGLLEKAFFFYLLLYMFVEIGRDTDLLLELHGSY